MHRQPLLELLDRHTRAPLDPGERASLDQIVEFVRREARCFDRATVEGHITGSAWILDSDRAHTILVHHKKLGFWLQPGGHADGEADVLSVAWREAREESGITGLEPLSREIFDVDVHVIPARKADPEHFHFDVRFAFVAPPGARPVVSEESHDVRWVPRDALAGYATDASVLRMAKKWAPSI